MMPLRTPLVAVLAVTAALAGGASAAGASTAPTGQFSVPTAGFPATPIAALPIADTAATAAGACTTATGDEGQGRTGGNDNTVCAGLSFIGPSVGQVATVIGPTIMSPAFTGVSIVSAGNVAIGP
jgi:hypothetical protein